jgi:hypothetical protein
LGSRGHDQIEVFHRNGAQQDLLPQYQGPDEARPIAKCNFDGADIITNVPLAIGSSYFALLDPLQTKLQHDMRGKTQVERTRVDKGRSFEWREPRVERIAKYNLCGN